MVNLLDGANETLKNYLGEDNTKDIYLDLVEQAENNHPTIFVKSMQVYIVRIAIGMSEVISTPKMSPTPTYLSALDYLCMKLLHDNKLFNSMSALTTLVDEKTPMNDVLVQYNHFIKKLLTVSDLPILKSCQITPGEHVSEQTQNKVYERAPDSKDELCGNTKIHVSIESEYLFDPYNKAYQFKLHLEWTDLDENEYLYLTVLNTYTNKTIFDKVKFKSLKEGKGDLEIDLRDIDINDRYLCLWVTFEKRKEYVMKYKVTDGFEEKGLIFKKKVEKYHYEEEKYNDKVGVSSFELNKFLSLENNKYGKVKG